MSFTFASGDVATISVDGTDISGAVESVKFDRKAKDERHHVLGSGAVVTLVQSPEYTITIKGLIDSGVASIFTSNMTANPPSIAVVHVPQGGISRTCQARITDYSETTDGDKAGTFDATLVVDGDIT